MEGLDRPKVGEWRDTKGFYGASIPLAWAQDPRRDVLLTFKMHLGFWFWMEPSLWIWSG